VGVINKDISKKKVEEEEEIRRVLPTEGKDISIRKGEIKGGLESVSRPEEKRKDHPHCRSSERPWGGRILPKRKKRQRGPGGVKGHAISLLKKKHKGPGVDFLRSTPREGGNCGTTQAEAQNTFPYVTEEGPEGKLSLGAGQEKKKG